MIRGSDGVTLRIPASRIREIVFTPDAREDKSRTSNDVTPPVVPSPTSLTQKRTSRDPSAPIAFGLAAGATIYFVDKAMADSGGIRLPVLGGLVVLLVAAATGGDDPPPVAAGFTPSTVTLAYRF